MKVYLVTGGQPSWWQSGWGHSIKDGGCEHVLGSFLEFVHAQQDSVAIPYNNPTYQPKPKKEET